MSAKPSTAAVFLMLARSHEARVKAMRTIHHVAGQWNVRIGGPVMGTTRHYASRQGAVSAVHRHYDKRLHSALHSDGWQLHLDKVATRASDNRHPMTLRRVIAVAWGRRRWPHTEDHRWVVERGRRFCTLCRSSRRLARFRE